MRRYCTYFDRGYLLQGLALWRSLARHDPDATLTVLALDETTETAMRAAGGPRVHVLPLGALLQEDAELASARESRGRREFIFTLTPALLRHELLRGADGDAVAYLDADLFFFSSASAIWKEMGDGSVYIVPHRFPAWHDDSARYGRFNVGVVAMRNDESGRACVEWWRARCLESAALTGDGTHYGDQKYLDDWPEQFGRVVVSRHPGINLAPWNWAAQAIDVRGETVKVAGESLVVFHFAQFRRIDAGWFDSGQLEYGIMPRELRVVLYEPYQAELDAAERELAAHLPGFGWAGGGWRVALGRWHLAALRLVAGQFWRRGDARWTACGLGLGRYSGRALAAYRRWQRRDA